jgi:hypothetical protein
LLDRFEHKDELKKRGHRWSSSEDSRPKAWYIDVDEEERCADEPQCTAALSPETCFIAMKHKVATLIGRGCETKN